MPVTPPAKVDLRALIQDRRARESRPTVRHTLCFDPDLLDELRDLTIEKELRDKSARDKADPDPRMGKKDTLAVAIESLEEAVAAASVVAVFRVPTREKQADYNRMIEDDEDVDPLMVRECFSGFLRSNNEPIPETELGRDDLEAWLALASRGDVNAIAYKIAQRSMGTPDFPASVQRSMKTAR